MRRRALLGLAAGAAAGPFAVLAQSRVYRVAFLALAQNEDASLLTKPLRELGYTEGTNLSVLYRSAAGDPARLAGLAAELVVFGAVRVGVTIVLARPHDAPV